MKRLLILNDDSSLDSHYLSFFPKEEFETEIMLVNGPLETVPTITLTSEEYDVILSFLMLAHPESLENLDLRKNISKEIPIVLVIDVTNLELLGSTKSKIIEEFTGRNKPVYIMDIQTDTLQKIKEKVHQL